MPCTVNGLYHYDPRFDSPSSSRKASQASHQSDGAAARHSLTDPSPTSRKQSVRLAVQPPAEGTNPYGHQRRSSDISPRSVYGDGTSSDGRPPSVQKPSSHPSDSNRSPFGHYAWPKQNPSVDTNMQSSQTYKPISIGNLEDYSNADKRKQTSRMLKQNKNNNTASVVHNLLCGRLDGHRAKNTAEANENDAYRPREVSDTFGYLREEGHGRPGEKLVNYTPNPQGANNKKKFKGEGYAW